MGDECDCGICEVDTCDLCQRPALFIDTEQEAWCAVCWDDYQQTEAERITERVAEAWHGASDWQGAEAYQRAMRDAGR